MKRALLFASILILVSGAIAGAILLTSERNAKTPVPDTAEVPSPRVQTFRAMQAAGDASVYVEDQEAGSTNVSVGFAIMPNAGYVEIRADEDGHPGATIGTSRPLPSGGGEHVSVDVDLPLEAHAIYYALLVDEGKTPVTDTDGNIVLMSFAALPGVAPETEAVEP
ncbi:hypothetical protein EBS80_03275 [bacterium]|nr:hypothetical protein [bacterium]